MNISHLTKRYIAFAKGKYITLYLSISRKDSIWNRKQSKN